MKSIKFPIFIRTSWTVLALALTVLGACLLGCGGSGSSSSSNSGSGTGTSALHGSARLSITWPVRTRLIPVAANSITVSFLNGKNVVATQTVARPSNGATSTVQFPSVLVGTYTLTSVAYPSTNGSGTAQASASQSVTVIADQTINVSITMDSTIATLAISPTTPTVQVGNTTTVMATALNSSGATVLVSAQTISWTSSNTSIATITSAGVLTGVAQGTTLLTVTESESGKTASESATVLSNGTTIVSLATTYISSLSSTQQAITVVAANSTNATKWSNLSAVPASDGTNSLRNGVAYSSLTTAQQTAFNNVVTAVLNGKGQDAYVQIQASDNYLGTLNTGYSGNYEYMAFVGTPSTSGTWMLQLGGHDIVHNYYFNGANLATTTPYFLGVEPPSFTYNSATEFPMSTQQAAMLSLISSLSSTQLSSAKLTETFSDVLLGPYQDARSKFPTGTADRGILASSLSTSQQTLLENAISAWTGLSPLAETYQTLYQSDLSQTYVAYSGTTALTTAGDYVRIDGPHCWIEFVVQTGQVISGGIRYDSVWRDRVTDYDGAFGF